MPVTKVSTHENTPGARPPLSLNLIKEATIRRKTAALGAGTPGSPIKGFTSPNFVKSSTVPIDMGSARNAEGKTKASGAKSPTTSNGGRSKETWPSATGNTSLRVSDWIEATNLESPRVVPPAVATKDETGYGNDMAGQLHMLKGDFKTNCTRCTYAPRQRSLLGLNEMDTRPATSPRTSRPKVHKLRHTLSIEVMHVAEPLRSARHGNWKYHLAIWTMQRQATRQNAPTP